MTTEAKINLLDVYGIDAIYHMTHIENLFSILQSGLLSHANGLTKRDISNHSVNSRRHRREPVYGNSIHSYVPFYFNPKNAMLYVRKELQNDIVILSFDRNLILEDGSLFTDGNASADATRFSNNLNDLSMINWNCIRDERWTHYPDGKRERMAEVLVPNRVSTTRLNKIICHSTSTYIYLLKLLNGRVKIELNNNKFYF